MLVSRNAFWYCKEYSKRYHSAVISKEKLTFWGEAPSTKMHRVRLKCDIVSNVSSKVYFGRLVN